MLVGIIPGPHEPSLDINSFIGPLVSELNTLWDGKEMDVCGYSSKQTIRCALLSAACDLPAGRKLCGFLSFFGCSKCWKEFPGEIGNTDFSGFDKKSQPRTVEQHKNTSSKLLQCNTKSAQSQLVSNRLQAYSIT